MRCFIPLLIFVLFHAGCAPSSCPAGACDPLDGASGEGATGGTSEGGEGHVVNQPDGTGGSPEGGAAAPPDGPDPGTPPPPDYEGKYVRASGHDMVDPSDNKLLLKTMNLGNWLLVEGYMWHLFPDNGIGVRHRVVEQKVEELLGPAAAAKFWGDYRANYITSEDMRAIKALGFNSVRLPMNARFMLPEGGNEFREEGFADVQRALDLAREAGLYVVLDMHAAPGGQAGKDIDDSPDYCADLFLQPSNQDRLVDLWREIARRWATDPIIAGYDLLNEPIPWRDQLWDKCRPSEEDYWDNFVHALYPLYQRVGEAIREVDGNHMLIVQGAFWGSDVQHSLGAPFDENMAYSFHFYHTPAHQNEIRDYVDVRAAWNRPIWVGEFGEDTNEHYHALIELFEANNFGWAFWTWKRINSTSGPYSIEYPDQWHHVENYIVHNSGPPGDWNAQATFDSFVTKMHFSNNSPNNDVIFTLSN